MDLKLDGRVVIVTGASRGIGRAIAEVAAEEKAIVVVVGRDVAACSEVVQGLGGGASYIRCDVADAEDTARLVEETVRRHGRIDAIVNNAGRFGGGPIADVAAAAITEGFQTKVVGPLTLVQAALPYLRASNQARVLNISGITADRIMPGAGVTALANSSMVTLSAYLARELAADRINVNAILPGYILTDPWKKRVADFAEREGLDPAAAADALLAREGMGHSRWGTTREIADLAVFLLSAQAAFISGAAFRVDGAQFVGIQR